VDPPHPSGRPRARRGGPVQSGPVTRHPAHAGQSRAPGARRRGWILAGVGLAVILVLAAVFALVRAGRAAAAATEGKRALLQAEKDLGAHRVTATRADLDHAAAAFARVRREIHALGPVRPVAEHVPFVRVQLQGASAYAAAGDLLTSGARNVTDAASEVLNPPNQHLPLSEGVDALRRIRTALDHGIDDIDAANARILALNGDRLIGPLDSARRQLARELPAVQQRAEAADQGLAALIDFAGGNGARRYLVFSQNPDEPRPTGGFIGTYGVISAQGGHVSLERYASIESWYLAHPETDIPPSQAPTAFKIPDPPVSQTFANVNAVADWPTAARLAMSMWQRGGEAPVDGVLSVTPRFLAVVVGVLGPVAVPGYGETVTSSNLVERVDYYTHVEAGGQGADRKEFVVELARAVMQKLLDAPAGSWDPLGRAVAGAFGAREAMAWSTASDVQTALRDRRWDGTLPAARGDFFYDGEFAYAAKNGRGLQRTFDHKVTLQPDGSGRVTTTVTVANTEPANQVGFFNVDSLSYVTFYGPTGGTFVGSSVSPDTSEPSISGHPAMGWDLSAPPQGTTTLTFSWSAPGLAVRQPDGTWRYQLLWMRLPGHTGDTLHLHVEPPPGWRWKGPPPPSAVALAGDFSGAWTLEPAHRG